MSLIYTQHIIYKKNIAHHRSTHSMSPITAKIYLDAAKVLLLQLTKHVLSKSLACAGHVIDMEPVVAPSVVHVFQDEGNATFQLALISDGMTSYALVYYMVDAMRWTYRGRWSYVIIGISYGDGDSFQRNLYSRTETAYRLDSVSGNTGTVVLHT